MIVVYHNKQGKLCKTEVESGGALPRSILWIDLIEPTIEEERFIEKRIGIEAPNREELDKIEVLSPFYKEDNAYFMTVTAPYTSDVDHPKTTPITFVLTTKCLVTVRHSRPRFFNVFSARALRKQEDISAPDVFLEGLIETAVHIIADALERTGNDLDDMLIKVFERNGKVSDIKSSPAGADGENLNVKYDDIIKQIGRHGNFISKNRESLVSISRLLIFFGQIEQGLYISSKEQRTKFKNIAREVNSLNEYANFLANRNNFLLDATLGMLNVEQNMIIKVFTVAAAVFMPPTLIASIYGMNFKGMPELDWFLGYPFAIILMLISALLPFYFFKKKGWL